MSSKFFQVVETDQPATNHALLVGEGKHVAFFKSLEQASAHCKHLLKYRATDYVVLRCHFGIFGARTPVVRFSAGVLGREGAPLR